MYFSNLKNLNFGFLNFYTKDDEEVDEDEEEMREKDEEIIKNRC